MDKAGLEALATGVPVITTNESFKPLLHPFGLFVASTHPALIADEIQKFMNRTDRASIVATLRGKVVQEHSLAKLVPTILSLYRS
jgi:glycosyltransferase involved in cell wall biosynthesis